MITVDELYKLFKKSTGISTDSRTAQEGAMFFALKGEKFDGNDYAVKALENGAKYAIVDRATLDGTSVRGKRYCILVENVLKTMQQLASYHRRQFDIPVIGITGTNGKTTTKELVSAVLSKKYNIVATKDNINNQIGVPLTLFRINEKTRMAVVEMGASAPGEIFELVDIALPTHGIVTNVGKAHLEGFGSFEGVKKTKGEMYDYLRQKGGTAFYNADNKYLCEMISARHGLVTRKYGCQLDGVEVLPVSSENPFLRIRLTKPEERVVNTQLVGQYNADNVMAALCVGKYFEVPFADAVSAIESFKPSNNRSQMLHTGRNDLIVDTYNANPTSMMAALENFAATEFENKTLMLGDMLELGEDSHAEHKAILEYALTISDLIYLVGPEFNNAARELGCNPEKVKCFGSFDEIYNSFIGTMMTNRTILIKGSHGMQLEKLPEVL